MNTTRKRWFALAALAAVSLAAGYWFGAPLLESSDPELDSSGAPDPSAHDPSLRAGGSKAATAAGEPTSTAPKVVELTLRRSGTIRGTLVGPGAGHNLVLLTERDDTRATLRPMRTWARAFAAPIAEAFRTVSCKAAWNETAFRITIPEEVCRADHGKRCVLLLENPEQGNAPAILARFPHPDAGETRDLGACRAAPVPLLQGRVVDAEGAPVERAQIAFRLGGEETWIESPDGGIGTHAETDADGRFRVPVSTACASIVVMHPRYEPRYLPCVRTTAATPLVIRLEPGQSLRGSIQSGDHFDPDARALLIGSGRRPWVLERRTPLVLDEAGAFEVFGVAQGVYSIEMRDRNDRRSCIGSGCKVTGAAQVLAPQRFALDARLRIRIAEAKATQALQVHLVQEDQLTSDVWEFRERVPLQPGQTEVLVDCPAGTWRTALELIVGTARIESPQRVVSLSPGQTMEIAGPGADESITDVVAIQLVRTDGSQLTRLRRAICRCRLGAAQDSHYTTIVADHLGRVELPAPASGYVSLSIEVADRDDVLEWAGRPAELPNGMLVFQEPDRLARLEVRRADGSPAEKMLLQVTAGAREADLANLEGAAHTAVVRRAWTDAEGRCSFAGLRDDRIYTIAIRPGGPSMTTNGFVPVGRWTPEELAGERPAKTVVLEGVRAHGRLVDGSGAPVAGASILLRRVDKSGKAVNDHRNPYYAATDQDGAWTFENIVPGTWRLIHSPTGIWRDEVATEPFTVPVSGDGPRLVLR